MLKYIKDNSTDIAATTAKVVAAIIVPGGFIIWGAYEYGKYKQRKEVLDEMPDSPEIQREEKTETMQ